MEVAQEGLGVLFCWRYPNLWYGGGLLREWFYTAATFNTTCILFSKLQMGSELGFFCNFAFLSTRSTTLGCYIDFSGFSNFRVNSA